MARRSLALLFLLRALAYAEGGSIEGALVDPTGAVIPLADVALRSKGEASSVQNAETDLKGGFRLTGVAPGDYELVISKAGFASQTKTIAVTEGRVTDLGTIALALGPIPACSGYTLEVPAITSERTNPGHTRLHGIIKRTDGVVLSGVTVILKRVDESGNPAIIRSDEWGKFSFDGITAGRYSLRAKLPGYVDFVIDRIQIKPSQTAHLSDLEMPQCRSGVRCRPVQKVRVPEICL